MFSGKCYNKECCMICIVMGLGSELYESLTFFGRLEIESPT